MLKETTRKGAESRPVWGTIESFARQQIQGFLQRVLEEEVTELVGRAKSERRAPQEPRVYRNGYGKPRQLTMTGGTITLRRPRVRGSDDGLESQVLPLFKRRTEEVGALLPQLYLHGLALGDFELAFRGLLGEDAALSPATMLRLKADWQIEYEAWQTRSLEELDIVYLWADGLYVKAGLEDGKAALLVLIGADTEGQKHVLAIESGQRESTECWTSLLRNLRARGLKAPRLTTADGHLGIWGALAQIYPESAEQRCWNHKLINVLDQVPLKKQTAVKAHLRKIMYAESRAECERLRKQCVAQFSKLYPKAMAALERDWERMVTFFDFPQEHWKHLRTTNVIESPFAAVRLRTNAGKRYRKVENACALIWKLLMVAEKTFRRLNAPALLRDVAAGVKYKDGIKVHSNRVAA